jgi:rhodanese-related sulfurtransferase
MRTGREGTGAPALVLAAIALVLGGGAMLTDTVFAAGPTAVDDGTGRIEPVTLAQWIRDGQDGLRVVDVRSPEAFGNGHIATAINVPAGDVAAPAFDAGLTIVLYDEGAEGDDAAQRSRSALLASGLVSARVLDGGWIAWTSEVMRPRLRADAKPAERRAFDDIAELSRWFGGVPRVATPGESPETPATRARAARRLGC